MPNIPPEAAARMQTMEKIEELFELFDEYPELTSNIEEVLRHSPRFVEKRPRMRLMLTLHTWMRCGSARERKACLDTHPELLSDDVETMINEYIDNVRGELKRMLEEDRDMLARARAVGIDAAYAEWKEREEQEAQELGDDAIRMEDIEAALDSEEANDPLMEVLFDWLENPWNQRREFVQEHPELLSDRADYLMTWLIEHEQMKRVMTNLETHRDVLRRARSEGIDKAFEGWERPSPLSDISPRLRTRLRGIKSGEDLGDLIMEFPQIAAVIERALRSATDNPQMQLFLALNDWVSKVQSWHESRAFLHAHPELLSDEAFEMLEQLSERATGTHLEKLVDMHLKVLKNARIHGVDMTYHTPHYFSPRYESASDVPPPPSMDEYIHSGPEPILNTVLAWIDCAAQSWHKSKVFMQEHSNLLSDEAEQELASLTQGMNDTTLKDLFERHLAILRLARTEGIDAAFAEYISPDQQLQSDDPLLNTLQTWIDQPTDDARDAYLQAHPELLSDEVLNVMTLLILQQENEHLRRKLERHRDILREVRSAEQG